MFKLPSLRTKSRLWQVLFFGCLLHRRPIGEDLVAAGAAISGCSVLAAAAAVAIRDARRCRLHPCQPTRMHPVPPRRRRRLTCPESRLHHDPEDSRGNRGILGTRGLSCIWYPTSPLSASCSGRLVSAPGSPAPKLPHSLSRNLQGRGTHFQTSSPLPFPFRG